LKKWGCGGFPGPALVHLTRILVIKFILSGIQLIALVVSLGYRDLEVLILQPAVPYLEIEEAAVVIEFHLAFLELPDDLLLFVALAADLHAADAYVAYLLLECLQLGLLQTLQLLLVGLLLECHQLLLHLQHVEAVGREEVPLVSLQYRLQLRVQLQHLRVDLTLESLNLRLVVDFYNKYSEIRFTCPLVVVRGQV
jgi:hypothetical protein